MPIPRFLQTSEPYTNFKSDEFFSSVLVYLLIAVQLGERPNSCPCPHQFIDSPAGNLLLVSDCSSFLF